MAGSERPRAVPPRCLGTLLRLEPPEAAPADRAVGARHPGVGGGGGDGVSGPRWLLPRAPPRGLRQAVLDRPSGCLCAGHVAELRAARCSARGRPGRHARGAALHPLPRRRARAAAPGARAGWRWRWSSNWDSSLAEVLGRVGLRASSTAWCPRPGGSREAPPRALRPRSSAWARPGESLCVGGSARRTWGRRRPVSAPAPRPPRPGSSASRPAARGSGAGGRHRVARRGALLTLDGAWPIRRRPPEHDAADRGDARGRRRPAPAGPSGTAPVGAPAGRVPHDCGGTVVGGLAALRREVERPSLVLRTLVQDLVLVPPRSPWPPKVGAHGCGTSAWGACRSARCWAGRPWVWWSSSSAGSSTSACSTPRASRRSSWTSASRLHASLLVLGVLVMVVAPVVEELFFRGFFYRALRTGLPDLGRGRDRRGRLPGRSTTRRPTRSRSPILAVLGAIFCLVYERTGSLYR